MVHYHIRANIDIPIPIHRDINISNHIYTLEKKLISCIVSNGTSSEIENKISGDPSNRKEIPNPLIELIAKSSSREKSDYINRNPFENDDLNPFLTTESDPTSCLQQTRKEGSQYKSLTNAENSFQENTAITGESLEERLHYEISQLSFNNEIQISAMLTLKLFLDDKC